MLDSTNTRKTSEGAFQILGRIIRSWDSLTKEVLTENYPETSDRKSDVLEHFNRLNNIDTMLAFGYVSRYKENTGNAIPQSFIVQTLYEEQLGEEELNLTSIKSRDSIRMDVTRRFKALEYFELVERVQKAPTYVEIELTERGSEVAHMINKSLEKLGD